MAKLIQQSAFEEAEREHEGRSFADGLTDGDLEDLTYAWGRVSDPGLRRLAIRFIRMLGEDHLGEQMSRSTLT